jgi:hypothetical protein
MKDKDRQDTRRGKSKTSLEGSMEQQYQSNAEAIGYMILKL